MNDMSYTHAYELKKIQRVKLFYTHTACYLIINSILLTANLAVNPAYLWFIWPLVFWTKGLLLHAFSTFDTSPSVPAEQLKANLFNK
jgi:hypothetical protein